MTFPQDYKNAVLASLQVCPLSYPPPTPEPRQSRFKCGLLFRLASFWIGAHWSPYNRRWCINVVPCVTFWIVLPGGNTP